MCPELAVQFRWFARCWPGFSYELRLHRLAFLILIGVHEQAGFPTFERGSDWPEGLCLGHETTYAQPTFAMSPIDIIAESAAP